MSKAIKTTSAKVSADSKTAAAIKVRLPKPGKARIGDHVKSW